MINLVNRTRGFSEEAEKEILGNIIYQMSTSSRPCAGTVPDVTWSQSSEQTHRVLINTFILQVQKLWLKKVEAYLMHMEKTVARAGADCNGTHMGISQADGTVLYHDSDGTYRTWSSFQNLWVYVPQKVNFTVVHLNKLTHLFTNFLKDC